MRLSYCDYLSHLARGAFVLNNAEGLISKVSPIRYDLGPNGEFRSTKKSLEIQDAFGTCYRVTIEEIPEGQA
jgi:hypothetical protein